MGMWFLLFLILVNNAGVYKNIKKKLRKNADRSAQFLFFFFFSSFSLHLK